MKAYALVDAELTASGIVLQPMQTNGAAPAIPSMSPSGVRPHREQTGRTKTAPSHTMPQYCTRLTLMMTRSVSEGRNFCPCLRFG